MGPLETIEIAVLIPVGLICFVAGVFVGILSCEPFRKD